MAEELKQTEEVKTEKTEDKKPEIDYKAELAKLQAENERLRNANTKASSDVASFKRQLQERMSAEEKAEEERKERRAAELAELEELRNEKRISQYTAKLMAGGYDAETASIMAKALPDGVQDTYFETVKAHNESITAKAMADALKQQPKPTPGGVPQGTDPELDRMLRGAGLK